MDVLEKISHDRNDTLHDKRLVIGHRDNIQNLDTLKANRIRQQFNLQIQNRRMRNQGQIDRYLEALNYIYKLPHDFPLEKLSFLEAIKKRLDRGEVIGKDFLLSLMDRMHLFSDHWQYLEQIISIFRYDPDINVDFMFIFNSSSPIMNSSNGKNDNNWTLMRDITYH